MTELPGGELLDIGRSVIERAAGLPGDIEVYVQHSQTLTVKVYQGEVESLVAGEPRGIGVRFVTGGRTGYAYTGDFSPAALDEVVAMASTNAAAADLDEHVSLPHGAEAYPEVLGLWRPSLLSTPVERKIALAIEAEKIALSSPEIETVEESAYVDSATRMAIISSKGVEAYGEQTFCYVYLSAHARRGDDVQTGLGFVTGREPEELDPVSAAQDAALQASRLLGARPCPTGKYTVVLDREVAAAVFSVAARALSAEAVQKGRSLFAGKVGELVAAPSLSLVDHGLHPDGMSSASFDDEGVPRKVTSLIEEGVLKGFLHDTYTAAREGGGTQSTGNAERGSYRGSPGVAASNLVLDSGEGTLEELFARVGTGLYVVSITGLASGANPVSGEFSVGARGLLIEGGALTTAVREVTIASDLVSLLSNAGDRAGDARWIPFSGSVYTPSFAVTDVTVAGT